MKTIKQIKELLWSEILRDGRNKDHLKIDGKPTNYITTKEAMAFVEKALKKSQEIIDQDTFEIRKVIKGHLVRIEQLEKKFGILNE